MCCLPDAADAAQLVELRIHAVANQAAVAGDRRRLVEQRAIERVAHVREIVELGDEASHERRLHVLEHQTHARDGGDRLAQRDEVARTGGSQGRARDEAFDVVHVLQRVAKLGSRGAAEREVLDGVEPIVNPLERDERPSSQARSSRPPIGVTVRSISCSSDPVRPPSAASITSRFLSVIGVDEQAVGAAAKADVAHVRELGFLRVVQILHERAGRGDRGVVRRRARSPASDCARSCASSVLPRRS